MRAREGGEHGEEGGGDGVEVVLEEGVGVRVREGVYGGVAREGVDVSGGEEGEG